MPCSLLTCSPSKSKHFFEGLRPTHICGGRYANIRCIEQIKMPSGGGAHQTLSHFKQSLVHPGTAFLTFNRNAWLTLNCVITLGVCPVAASNAYSKACVDGIKCRGHGLNMAGRTTSVDAADQHVVQHCVYLNAPLSIGSCSDWKQD